MPTDAAGRVAAPAGAAMLHVAHRVNGVLVAALVLAIAARSWQPRGGLASGLGLTLITGLGAGFAAALVPSALGMALVHNLCAALLIALLTRAAASPIVAR
jgi:predicted lipid-binding transport protein (Tim44 family)